MDQVGQGERARGVAKSRPSPAAAAPTGRTAEILQGLREIFLAEGFRRTTVGELARRLRCSRRTLYEVADSKDALFLLVLDRLLDRIEQEGRRAAAEAEDVREKIFAFLEPGIAELRTASAAFFADITSLASARSRLEAHQQERRRQLRALVEQGVECGAFRRLHAEIAVEVMLAAYRAVTRPDFLTRVDVTLTDSVREGEDLLLNGLLHPED